MAEIKRIDERRLESDINYRYEFLTDFMGFSEEDAEAIHRAAAELMPRIPDLVEATYEKLLSFDATRRHFVPRQHGYDGPLPENPESLSVDHEQIQFRKEHLRRYLMNILGNAYDSRMTKYLDVVGKIHTPKAGNKQIDVPLVQMNAFMGMLSDILLTALLEAGFDGEQQRDALLAFNKFLWIQNDLISRHYQPGINGQTQHERAVRPPAAAWK